MMNVVLTKEVRFFLNSVLHYVSRACVCTLFASAIFTYIYYNKEGIIFYFFQRKHARIQKFIKELDPVQVEHRLKVKMHVLEILYVDKLWVYKGK